MLSALRRRLNIRKIRSREDKTRKTCWGGLTRQLDNVECWLLLGSHYLLARVKYSSSHNSSFSASPASPLVRLLHAKLKCIFLLSTFYFFIITLLPPLSPLLLQAEVGARTVVICEWWKWNTHSQSGTTSSWKLFNTQSDPLCCVLKYKMWIMSLYSSLRRRLWQWKKWARYEEKKVKRKKYKVRIVEMW